MTIYLLMLVPLLFLYPNNNNQVELNYKREWFTDISKKLKGDCFRKAQDFKRECPFPTREIHLNKEHTIVEIRINKKWIAYDPCFDLFFDNYNVVQISFDVKREFFDDSIKNYPYKDSFKSFHYYHNFYFILINYTHPYYDHLLRLYYGIIN
ncbi:MAG: hypothetical protein ACOYO1_00160 [Bacteroidales bacterium]